MFVYTYAIKMNSCVYIAAISIQNCFWDVLTVVLFHTLHHKCFARSGSLLQFKSHIIDSIIYNSNFQYTQDKLSLLDICVEKQEIWLVWQLSMFSYTCWLDSLKTMLTGVTRSVIEQSVQLVEERTGDMINWLGWSGSNHLDKFW